MKKQSQSIWDNLISLMPNLNRYMNTKENVDPQAAKTLYNIWRTSSVDKQNKTTFKRPDNIGLDSLERAKKDGLIKIVGSSIEVTDKGQEALKVMILGDNSSAFDKRKIDIDYHTALKNVKNLKTAKKNKLASNNWWDIALKDEK